MQLPHQYFAWIDRKTNPIDPYNHIAGYSQTDGYFYIEDGDRGEIYLNCCSFDIEDTRWYLLKSVVSHIGQEYELTHRKSDEKRWRYLRTFKERKLLLKQQLLWKYNAVHDTRKLKFEYEIKALVKVADGKRLEAFVNERTGLKMLFIEISDSKERR